jgi:L-fucose mutarotase/ribose pyranase (RbsD/FucU family)
MKQFENKITELENKLKLLDQTATEAITKKDSHTPDSTHNTCGTTIVNNNNVNIIVINSYKDPSLDHLTEKDYKAAIKRIVMSVPEIIRRIHFDSRAPENHNILLTNFRSKHAKVFDGKEWRTIEEDKLIDMLLDDNEYLLEQWGEDHPEQKELIERYKQIKESDKEAVIKEIRKEIKTLIYDKRKMIMAEQQAYYQQATAYPFAVSMN